MCALTMRRRRPQTGLGKSPEPSGARCPCTVGFEQIVTWVLVAMVGLIVCVALFRLVVDVVRLLLVQALDPLGHEVFQTVFGAMMTVLIALEFSHQHRARLVPAERNRPGQTVLLIALLALARSLSSSI
jgi:hypothetical protein